MCVCVLVQFDRGGDKLALATGVNGRQSVRFIIQLPSGRDPQHSGDYVCTSGGILGTCVRMQADGRTGRTDGRADAQSGAQIRSVRADAVCPPNIAAALALALLAPFGRARVYVCPNNVRMSVCVCVRELGGDGARVLLSRLPFEHSLCGG